MLTVFDPNIYFEIYLDKFNALMFILEALVTALIFRLLIKNNFKVWQSKTPNQIKPKFITNLFFIYIFASLNFLSLNLFEYILMQLIYLKFSNLNRFIFLFLSMNAIFFTDSTNLVTNFSYKLQSFIGAKWSWNKLSWRISRSLNGFSFSDFLRAQREFSVKVDFTII